MAIISTQNPWAFLFGLLGNVVSLIVYLAPVPTFIRIYKKKSTEGFQSVPYVVALFSAMLWIYYAWVKTNANLLITVNSVGCLIETVYIAIYITYASKKTRVFTMKLLILLNFGGFSSIILLTYFLAKGSSRAKVLGWVCVGFATSVFAAPLSIMRLVIRTKSVEFMPFWLSFFLTLSAVMWFFYGLFLKDYYIALPNTLGFAFGLVQMVLYLMYRNYKTVTKETELPEKEVEVVIKINTEVHPVSNNFQNNNKSDSPVETQEADKNKKSVEAREDEPDCPV